jgi:aldose 1-epimerase
MPDGTAVHLFTLDNNRGMTVKITNYGGIIASIITPDRDGKLVDVVHGHDTLDGYLNRSRYFGALCGRFANRIVLGKFTLNGVEYSLAQNNGENHLHGGLKGFDKVVWDAKDLASYDSIGVELSYLSQDGEEGYPGNLRVTVKYVLTETNELRLEYFATTDQDTVINLTNHSYFNLAGAGTILDHELTINADGFTPIRKGSIPTGEIRSVANTPLDFNRPTRIGARIDDDYEQLAVAGGYDFNFVLNDGERQPRKAAELFEPISGRSFEVLTTQPGMQFYSGNFLDGTLVGKSGRAYVKHSGCCFETQHFPDSPNQPAFPSTILKPGEKYEQTTVFRFSVE